MNIGNTRSAVASGKFPEDDAITYYPTADLPRRWQLPVGATATASCVVPLVRQRLAEQYGGRIHFIGVNDFPGLDTTGYDTSTLGSDRLANAAAAQALLPGKAVLVFDCGTALNSVAVDAQGRLCGGVILPGRETALRALSAAAAQLPEYAVDAPHQLNPLAVNTRAAILNGVDIGILGAAEALVRKTRRQAGFKDCAVWFTGGDAPFFVKYLPRSLHATLPPVPLTLYGIRLAARQAGKNAPPRSP